MRSSRSDYAVLSSHANDMPYCHLETYADIPADSKSAFDRATSSANNKNSYIPEKIRLLHQADSLNSRVSGVDKGALPSSPRVSTIDKGHELDRNHPLLSESIFGTQYRKALSSHFEWNSFVAADRFASSIAGERTLAGTGLGLVDRIPVFAAGENTNNQTFEHSLWFRDGSVSTSWCPLQRQSSGSSFADSLLSSDVPFSSISPTVSICASDSALCGTHSEGQIAGKGLQQSSANSQSWARLTEQSYNLQLTLALRLVEEAEIIEEPILLPSSNLENQPVFFSGGSSSVQATTLRFWVNGSLGYADKIRDGFYHIWGLNPYIWGLCSHPEEDGGRLPTLDLLRAVNPSDSLVEVVTIDKRGDAHLCDLENQAFNFALTAADTRDLAELLGKLVCESMGGAAATELGDLVPRWKANSKALKECLSCVVFPIGSVSVGACRHRALLFKALADSVNLPCRITRGCKYCGNDDGVSCLVLCGSQREFLVDLIATPGDLSCSEAFLKSRPAPKIVSPLRLPELKASDVSEGDGLATNNGKYLFSVQSEQREGSNAFWKRLSSDNLACRRPCTHSEKGSLLATPLANKAMGAFYVHHTRSLNGDAESMQSQELQASTAKKRHTPNDKCTVHNVGFSVEGKLDMTQQPAVESGHVASMHPSYTEVDMDEIRVDPSEPTEGNMIKAKSMELSLALDGLEIGWEELSVKERIGAGSFGTVHRADWNGSDVAVKVFIEQDLLEERLEEFMREVAIMKRTRHPNVVLFMGVVTKRPNLSIVTEYLPRGSLFRLLHRSGMRELLDERRRIRMALDVAKGMNYLHRLNPPIVHRDLKSPNLLVDKTFTVKVCDFGLSRLKMKTFLSSRSAAGTAEWMAPEVLRDEPSNEKSDVYSFGVILWELFTFQQPWSGLNPAQVVGAVGFQHRRLIIPKDINLTIATLIESCWANDPWQRPSFTSIMESLKLLQRPTPAAQVEVSTS